MSSIQSKIIDNMKQHQGKWVSHFSAIGNNIPFSEGFNALKQLVSDGIVEEDIRFGLPYYRYAPLPTFLEVIDNDDVD